MWFLTTICDLFTHIHVKLVNEFTRSELRDDALMTGNIVSCISSPF